MPQQVRSLLLPPLPSIRTYFYQSITFASKGGGGRGNQKTNIQNMMHVLIS